MAKKIKPLWVLIALVALAMFADGDNDKKTGFSCTSGCVTSSWSPDPATVNCGVPFTQTSNCGSTRTEVGTKDCSSSQTCAYVSNEPTSFDSFTEGELTQMMEQYLTSIGSTSTVNYLAGYDGDRGCNVVGVCSIGQYSTSCNGVATLVVLDITTSAAPGGETREYKGVTYYVAPSAGDDPNRALISDNGYVIQSITALDDDGMIKKYIDKYYTYECN